MAAEENKEVSLPEDKLFVTFFKSLKPTPNLVRLFDRGSVYHVHGDEAKFLALEYHKSLQAVRYWGGAASSNTKPKKGAGKASQADTSSQGDEGLAYLAVRNGPELEAVLNFLLLQRQCSVQLWQSKAGSKAWEVAKKASPGNLVDVEDLLFQQGDMSETPLLIAIDMDKTRNVREFGVAYVDTATRTIGISQFQDNDQFANLESVLVQLGAKEACVLNDPKNYDSLKLVDLLEKCNVPLVRKARNDFKSENIEQDLQRLLRCEITSHIADLDKKSAMSAVACLLAHLELLGDERNHRKYRLKPFDLSQFMRLDSSAVQALHLVPDAGDTNRTMNLVTLLNKCKTSMGVRRLHQWVKQPLLDIDQIHDRQKMVTALVEDTILRERLRTDCLRGVPDIDLLVRKVLTGKAKLQDCCTIYQFFVRLPKLQEALTEYSGPHADLLSRQFVEPMVHYQGDMSKFEQMIETTIDLDRIKDHEYFIKAEFDSKLQKLRNKIDKYYTLIQQLKEQTADELGIGDKKLNLDHSDRFGYHFRVTKKEELLLGNKLSGEYEKFDSQKSGCKFRGTRLTKLNDKHRKHSLQYAEHQSALVRRLMEIVASYIPLLETLSEQLACLDVFVSWAHVFATAPHRYVCPEVTPMASASNLGGSIVLRGSRHPCMEQQDSINFIPNDCVMERGSSSFHIITGPNMGGKSTFIRQIGVIVLMAQLGCYVPCESASVCVVDCILARVGAGDSQLRGVSTFMSEMLETAVILRSATENSLIIIDELGRGTSTYDGFGLAWAISEHICSKIGAFCFFATHFHELTALSEQQTCVRNFHVKAQTTDGTLTMLYNIQPGASDQSLGVHVAEMAGFPQAVLTLAKRKAAELENFEPSGKKQRTGKHGHELVLECLSRFAALPIDELSDAEVIKAVEGLKADFLTEHGDDPYVRRLIESAVPATDPTTSAEV